jgi:hypothetical protein
MKCGKCGHLLLKDTMGNFYLGIRLPTREYRPTEAHHRAQKKWRDNKDNKEHFNKWRRKWRKNLPKEKKEQYRLQKNEYMRAYYQRNRKKIMASTNSRKNC